MTAGAQATFAELEYGAKKRKTRRERFLERMDGLIPWEGPRLRAGESTPLRSNQEPSPPEGMPSPPTPLRRCR